MGFDMSGAEQGAGAGGSAGGPWGALAGAVLGGLFSKPPELPPEMKQLYDFQMGQANQMRQYSQSVPLSDPQEQMMLAEQRGLLGQQQGQQRQQLGSTLGMTAGGGFQNLGDYMRNITLQQTGQNMALDQQQLMAALQRRREAMMQAGQLAQGALGPGSGQRMGGYDFAPLFGSIAQQAAYNRSRQMNGGTANQGQGDSGNWGGGGGGYTDYTGGGGGYTDYTGGEGGYTDYTGGEGGGGGDGGDVSAESVANMLQPPGTPGANNIMGRQAYQPFPNNAYQSPQFQMPSGGLQFPKSTEWALGGSGSGGGGGMAGQNLFSGNAGGDSYGV